MLAGHSQKGIIEVDATILGLIPTFAQHNPDMAIALLKIIATHGNEQQVQCWKWASLQNWKAI